MNRLAKVSLLMAVVGMLAAGAAKVSLEPAAQKQDYAVRSVAEQTVLYTIYRGSYDKAGQASGKLFATAADKGIKPQGPPSFAYLNNPTHVSSEHWLTEIRIPVGKEELKHAGTLGPFTDIKALPAMQVVVAVKPKGLADPSGLYERLFTWIYKNGYMVIDAHTETFVAGGETGDYAQMASEILVPVEKLKEAQK